MAGKITVSTINDSSGVLATQNGMTGICKAWIQFQGGGGNTAGTINGSFNVSSLTVNGTGDYTVNITTALANINYSAVGSTSTNTSSTQQFSAFQIFSNLSTGTTVAPTTTTFRCNTGVYAVGSTTPTYVSVAVFGN
jgi:hypothetical protein